MRDVVKSTLVFMCSIAVAFPVWSSPASDALTQIQAAYQRRSSAWNHKNLASYVADLTSDYRMIYKGSASSRAAVVRQNQMFFSAVQNTRQQRIIAKFALGKGQAIADVKEEVNSIVVHPQTKKLMHLKTVATREDTWVIYKGKWRLKQSKVFSFTANVEGKNKQIHRDPSH